MEQASNVAYSAGNPVTVTSGTISYKLVVPPPHVNKPNQLTAGHDIAAGSRVQEQQRKGRLTKAESLLAKREKNQSSIQAFINSPTRNLTPKRKEVDSSDELDPENSSPLRTPKIRKMGSPQEMNGRPGSSAFDLSVLAEAGLSGDINSLSPETKLLLQCMQGISKQITVAKTEQTAQIASQESSINSRLDVQETRLEKVEGQIQGWIEVRTEENLLNRVEALEKTQGVAGGGEPVNSAHLTEWLSEVTERLEKRDRAELSHNVVISGLDMNAKNPRATVVTFLSNHFQLKQVQDDIANVSIVGREEHRRYRVVFKNPETRKQILKSKSKCLKDLPIYIQQENTPLEQKLSWKARELARAEQASGHTTEVDGKRVAINGKWHSWNHLAGKFVEDKAENNRAPKRTRGKNVSKKHTRKDPTVLMDQSVSPVGRTQ